MRPRRGRSSTSAAGQGNAFPTHSKKRLISSTGLDVFDTTIQETSHWLKIMMGELGTDDRRTAFNACARF